jgi:ketosteroid isomerase-like protein
MESLWMQAAATANANSYVQLLAPDFIFIMHGGEVLKVEDFLGSVRAGQRKIKSIEFESRQIRFYGDTAIVTGTILVDAEFSGVPFKGSSRITKVWVKFENRWVVASFHASDARLLDQWGKFKKPPGE